MKRIWFGVLAVAWPCAVALGCDSTATSAVVSSDAAATTDGTPSPESDAGPDSAIDTRPDSAIDTRPDSAIDVGLDSTIDVGDSGIDAGPDSAIDAGPTSATDAGPDSAIDVGPDSATDASVTDAGLFECDAGEAGAITCDGRTQACQLVVGGCYRCTHPPACVALPTSCLNDHSCTCVQQAAGSSANQCTSRGGNVTVTEDVP